jgi:hypothetical protein
MLSSQDKLDLSLTLVQKYSIEELEYALEEKKRNRKMEEEYYNETQLLMNRLKDGLYCFVQFDEGIEGEGAPFFLLEVEDKSLTLHPEVEKKEEGKPFFSIYGSWYKRLELK